MSSMGLFSPPSHYKGKFLDFSYNDRTQVTDQEWDTLNNAVQSNSIEGLTADQMAAVNDLVAQRQIAGNYESRADKKVYNKQGKDRMNQLESVLAAAKGKTITLSKDVKGAIKHAVKQVHKKSKTFTTLTDCMIWFFAFGLIGLGMQITKKAIFQAGGWPLVIGCISGVTKAVLSFLVVMWLVKDVVLN